MVGRDVGPRTGHDRGARSGDARAVGSRHEGAVVHLGAHHGDMGARARRSCRARYRARRQRPPRVHRVAGDARAAVRVHGRRARTAAR